MARISNTALADQIGALDAEIKALTEKLNALKDEAKSRETDALKGSLFTVTIDKSYRSSLDTASVKKELGDEWYKAHCPTSVVTTLRIKPNPGALVELASN